MSQRHLRRAAGTVLAWLVLAVPLWGLLLGVSAAHLTLAGHDAVVRPTLGGHAVVRTGPYLPDLRLPTGERFGVDIVLGKTDAASAPEMISTSSVVIAACGITARTRSMMSR